MAKNQKVRVSQDDNRVYIYPKEFLDKNTFHDEVHCEIVFGNHHFSIDIREGKGGRSTLEMMLFSVKRPVDKNNVQFLDLLEENMEVNSGPSGFRESEKGMITNKICIPFGV